MSATVYRAYDRDGWLLYVGCSRDVDKRIKAHAKRAEWYRDAVEWTYRPYPTREAALAAESEAIRTEHPLWNLQGAEHPRTCECPRCAQEREEMAAHVRRIVDTFPPLSPSQRDKLAALLRPAPLAEREGAAG